MVSLLLVKNMVMAPLMRLVIRYPNLMRSRVFLQAMRIFPQRISGSYDARMNDSQVHCQALLEHGLGLLDPPPMTVLDIATGTGIAAFAAARVFVQAQILGIDQSSGMLALARKKVDQQDVPRISFMQGNACSLPCDDKAYDLVLCSNAPLYLDEATRVLKSGGMLLVVFSFAGSVFTHLEPSIRNMLKPHAMELLQMEGDKQGVLILAKKQ
jgi:ubiquinone/menaquinone biosynthesis C-methylase UbiE